MNMHGMLRHLKAIDDSTLVVTLPQVFWFLLLLFFSIHAPSMLKSLFMKPQYFVLKKEIFLLFINIIYIICVLHRMLFSKTHLYYVKTGYAFT